jgi:hypothetical protein
MKDKEQFLKFVKKFKDEPDVEERRSRAFGKYADLFKPSNIANLDIEKFRKFFNFTENEHWTGLAQNITLLISHPKELKESLKILLDESKPILERINRITEKSGENTVKGFGLARISAILQFAYPKKYGAYNSITMEGLTKIGENPKDSESSWNSFTLGKKYDLVNQKLVEISRDYNISLWALDWVWWALVNNSEEDIPSSETSDQDLINEEIYETTKGMFALEKHLEDFLVENWDNTTLAKDLNLEILKDEENGQSIGQQYKLSNGKRIDLLCKNNKTGGFTVIELKRGNTDVGVIGQINMYMGWITKNFAKGKPVDGIIIAHESNDDLKYALFQANNIKIFTYEIEFNLKNEKLDL